MKRILILGAAAPQYDAMIRARQLGLHVHACSYRREGAGVAAADAFVLMDIRDSKSVRRYIEDHHIDLVYSVGSDLALPTMAEVSEATGKPSFISADTARACTHKNLFRARLAPFPSITLTSQTARSLVDLKDWMTFPCIAKPVDSQGQRGVRRVDAPSALPQAFEEAVKHSRTGAVIIEEYIDGPEFSVNGYVVRNRIVYLRTSLRLTHSEYPGGIIKRHEVESGMLVPGMNKRVHDACSQALEALDIQDGPFYAQLKCRDHLPVFLEFTPRLDGCHMWKLLQHAEGVDLLAAVFDHLLGKEPRFRAIPLLGRWALTFYCLPSGSAFRRTDHSPPAGEQVIEEWLYYDEGETIRPINGHMEKVGYAITRVPT